MKTNGIDFDRTLHREDDGCAAETRYINMSHRPGAKDVFVVIWVEVMPGCTKHSLGAEVVEGGPSHNVPIMTGLPATTSLPA